MSLDLDRSKYRNPDMPVGYVKQDSELCYLHGIEMDGVHYVWAPYIYEAHLDERSDQDELSDLGFMTPSSDEDIADGVKSIIGNGEKVIKDTETEELSLPCNIKNEKEEKESIKKDDTEKKGQDNDHTTTFNYSLFRMGMDMDTTKRVKKRKPKKMKKESKTDYRSDSCSPSPADRHHSPPSKSKQLSPPSTSMHPSSSSSHRHSPTERYEQLLKYPPSSSPERYHDVKVKEESIELPEKLPGHYYCNICNMTLNSLLTYNAHVNGKRHLKNFKLKKELEALSQNTAAPAVPEIQSRYPKPPSGVIRKKVKAVATVQKILEMKIKQPCPGLNFVTEIQGLEEVIYYCSLCDSVCPSHNLSPHLTGFKHQLNSVKVFKPAAYKKMQFDQKYKIEKEILNILNAIEKDQGRGNMMVEVEELAPISAEDWPRSMSEPNTSRYCQSQSSRDYPSQLGVVKKEKQVEDEQKYKTEKNVLNILNTDKKKEGKEKMLEEVKELAPTSQDWPHGMNEPSTSRDYPSQSNNDHPRRSRWDFPSQPNIKDASGDYAESFQEKYDKAAIPDTSVAGFYCKMCQSHMNSLQMWDQHIKGKRHLTNLKKLPGDLPSKIKTINIPGERARLLDRIKNECLNEPFVGLSEVQETQIPEISSYTYQCYLCGSCHSAINIMEHLISLKHRTKYLDRIGFPGREAILGMNEIAAYPLVRNMCIQVEKKEGSGNPSVHVYKNLLYK